MNYANFMNNSLLKKWKFMNNLHLTLTKKNLTSTNFSAVLWLLFIF